LNKVKESLSESFASIWNNYISSQNTTHPKPRGGRLPFGALADEDCTKNKILHVKLEYCHEFFCLETLHYD
jgi:hypothetical protein